MTSLLKIKEKEQIKNTQEFESVHWTINYKNSSHYKNLLFDGTINWGCLFLKGDNSMKSINKNEDLLIEIFSSYITHLEKTDKGYYDKELDINYEVKDGTLVVSNT